MPFIMGDICEFLPLNVLVMVHFLNIMNHRYPIEQTTPHPNVVSNPAVVLENEFKLLEVR